MTRARGDRAAAAARDGGLGGSAPMVARWLGDIRSYVPTGVVRVMQSDAMERLGLRQLLLEPELLEVVEPDMSAASRKNPLRRDLSRWAAENGITTAAPLT